MLLLSSVINLERKYDDIEAKIIYTPKTYPDIIINHCLKRLQNRAMNSMTKGTKNLMPRMGKIRDQFNTNDMNEAT